MCWKSNNPDTASRDVEEEVVLGDVGVIDGEIIRQRDGGRRVSWAARKRLRERNGSITSHEISQG